MEETENLKPEDINIIQLASRWDRLYAALIDAVLATLITIPVMNYLGIMELVKEQGHIPIDMTIKLGIYGVVMFLVMHGYLLNKYGQTIGKSFLNISIVTLNNKKPEFIPLILKRYLPLWLVGCTPVIGDLLVTIDVLFIFRKDKRCVHDLIAGTKVINTSKAILAKLSGTDRD